MNFDNLPFEVPDWAAPKKYSAPIYQIWGWHPNYPYWSQSCWEASTEEGARALLFHVEPGQLFIEVYAVALVKFQNGQYTVVETFRPVRVDIWEKIKAQKETALASATP